MERLTDLLPYLLDYRMYIGEPDDLTGMSGDWFVIWALLCMLYTRLGLFAVKPEGIE